jgi:hypothetical protein
MTKPCKARNFIFILLLLAAPSAFGQSASISSLTAISTPNNANPVPIFAIGRTANVVTVSTIDPSNPDQYAQQSNQVGVGVRLANVTVDPSNAVNGTFPICGAPTPGCVTPTTTNFSFLSTGANFSAASATPLGITAVVRGPGCPLIPTGYFSFCGDALPGAGLAYVGDGSLVEFVSTQDNTGSVLWASSLADGNSGTTRVTGCETGFKESGNEFALLCAYNRTLGGVIDIDMKNALFVLDVGDGNTGAVGGELVMSGTRKMAAFGISSNRVAEIDMGAVPSGTVMPSSGTLRLRNGSTVCWENTASTNGLCQSTDRSDRFNFDGGVVTPTYSTATTCANFQGQCGSAAAGSVVFPAQTTSVIIYTTAVTAQSQIFLQEDSSLSSLLGVTCNATLGRTFQITARTPGVGFIVTTNFTPVGNSACLSYHVLN